MANDILQPHSDETVSKNIADHKRPLQTSVMSNGKWYNISNTLLQMNDREDLHKVSKIVQQHQADITNAEKTANDAHSEAQKAIDNSTVASNAASEVSTAVSDAKSTASDAHSAAVTAQSNASAALSTASGAIHSAETEIDKAKANASTALSTANVASNAASSNALEISKTNSAIALKADSSAVDVVKSQVTSTSTLASQNANELQTKANESDVDALKKTVDTHTTEIDQNSKQIALKANSSDVDEVKKTVTSQAAEISATSSEVATKASQTTVDSLSGAVSQNTASIKTNADNITSKVTRDDVSGMLKDGSYATEKYVQTTAKQTADSFNQSVVDLNGKITNVNQSIDGLRTDVKGKADQSALTQLSGVVDSKVSSKDFETERTQLSNAINDRVSKGDVISQINQEAGGNTLIQVANGKGELLLDADSTVFSGKAFIPGASIASLSADKITAGLLNGVSLQIHGLDGVTTYTLTKNDQDIVYKTGISPITGKKFGYKIVVAHGKNPEKEGTKTLAFDYANEVDGDNGTAAIEKQFNDDLSKAQKDATIQKSEEYNYSTLIDDTGLKTNNAQILGGSLVLSSGDNNETRLDKKGLVSYQSVLGKIDSPGGPIAPQNYFRNSRFWNGTLSFSASINPLKNAEWSEHVSSIYGTPFEDGNYYDTDLHINASGRLQLGANNDDELILLSENPTYTHPDGTLAEKYVDISNETTSGFWFRNNVYSEKQVGGDQLIVFNGGTTHGRFDFNENYTTYENGDANGFWIKDTDLWVDGTVHGGSWVQTSTLSKKTNLTKLDPQKALDTINNTDIYDYQYKRDGKDGRHYASLVIDDVHEKPQTKTPEAFVSAEGDGRDDGTQLAYLTAAVQLIDQRLKKLEDKNGCE